MNGMYTKNEDANDDKNMKSTNLISTGCQRRSEDPPSFHGCLQLRKQDFASQLPSAHLQKYHLQFHTLQSYALQIPLIGDILSIDEKEN